MPRETQPLDAKLEQFDRHADLAVDEIIVWLRHHRRDLIAVARGRHIEGHYRYQEAGLFAYDDNHLLAEAAQEIADAIVYLARRAAISAPA